MVDLGSNPDPASLPLSEGNRRRGTPLSNLDDGSSLEKNVNTFKPGGGHKDEGTKEGGYACLSPPSHAKRPCLWVAPDCGTPCHKRRAPPPHSIPFTQFEPFCATMQGLARPFLGAGKASLAIILSLHLRACILNLAILIHPSHPGGATLTEAAGPVGKVRWGGGETSAENGETLRLGGSGNETRRYHTESSLPAFASTDRQQSKKRSGFGPGARD